MKVKTQANGPPPRPANNPLPPLLGKRRARDVDILLHPPPEPRKRCTSESTPLMGESDEWEEKKRDQRRGILKREKATLKGYHAGTSAPKDSSKHGCQQARIKDHSIEIKKTPRGSKDRKVGKPKFNEPADLRKSRSMRRSEEVKKSRSKSMDPAALRKSRSMCQSEEVKKSRSKSKDPCRSEEVKKSRSKSMDPAALRKSRSMCQSEEVKKSRSKSKDPCRSEEVKKSRSKSMDPAALRKSRSMCQSEEVKKSRSKSMDPAALNKV